MFVKHWFVEVYAQSYERPVGSFHISTSRIPDFISMNLWILDFNFQLHEFNFVNSLNHDCNYKNSQEFHLHEITILPSWIYDFNFQLHEFNFVNSLFQLHEFTIPTSGSHDFNFQLHEINFVNFKNSRFQLHEVRIVGLWSWNRDSWRWNWEFMKLKCPNRSFVQYMLTVSF
jgi:hypothetical protein